MITSIPAREKLQYTVKPIHYTEPYRCATPETLIDAWSAAESLNRRYRVPYQICNKAGRVIGLCDLRSQ